jgi:endonuclease/exonuclease/phosphatase family metal-dependent hydrolase
MLPFLIKVASYNIGDTDRKEESRETSERRSNSISSLLIAHSDDIDMLFLQNVGIRGKHSNTFGLTSGGLAFVLGEKSDEFAMLPHYYTESDAAIGSVILYRCNRFMLKGTKMVQYGDEGKAQGYDNEYTRPRRTFLFATFVNLYTEKEFVAINIHLPTEEAGKLIALDALKKEIEENIPKETPVIAAGDYDFIDEKGGVKMREFMYQFLPVDLADPLVSFEKTKEYIMSGTCLKSRIYPRQVDMAPNKTGNRYQNMPRLDHIFSRGCKQHPYKNTFCAIALRSPDATNINPETYPTDHVLIRVGATLL